MTSFGVFVFVICVSRINVCASLAKECKVMASVVLQGARVLFLVLTLTQCFLLASYPARSCLVRSSLFLYSINHTVGHSCVRQGSKPSPVVLCVGTVRSRWLDSQYWHRVWGSRKRPNFQQFP